MRNSFVSNGHGLFNYLHFFRYIQSIIRFITKKINQRSETCYAAVQRLLRAHLEQLS